MTEWQRLRFPVAVGLLMLMADQLSKLWLVDMLLARGEPVDVLPFFRLVMVWNRGVSFGMMGEHDARWMLIIGTTLVVLGLCFWLWRARDASLSLPLGLIIGGAIGNIIDRVHYGAVADFFDVFIGSYHWPAFNIADSAVVIGVLLLLLREWKQRGDA